MSDKDIQVPPPSKPAAVLEADARAAALKARNRRNLAIALALVAFVILVFISTVFHMSGGATPQPSHP
ncbi:MAG TPA: hypothetical protein VG407_15795 [Caulobacteraceae bacterium]|jgi:hypothetical protein|nr:hypothetical protein [Caulobacteraceae bacterium]